MTDARTPRPKRARLRDRSVALLSKHGLAVATLADALLKVTPGERIPRIQELAERMDVGVGTVQAAFDFLEASGVAELDARGRLGTYARRIDYAAIWNLALNRAVVGALPLPYSRRFEGLATGLREQFARRPLDLELRFARGSSRRLDMLAAHECDWAVVSRFAAETANVYGFSIETVLLLGPATYMAAHALVTRRDATEGDALRPGARVGIDPQSTDHSFLVRSLMLGRQVELVEIEYNQGLRLIRSGVIDATVWSVEDLPDDATALQITRLDERQTSDLARLSEAAIVAGREDRSASHLLMQLLDRDALTEIQRAVVSGARLPSY